MKVYQENLEALVSLMCEGREFNKDNLWETFEKAAEQCLKSLEKEILIDRFGLLDGKYKSLAKVGDKLHLTRERVRQLESTAIQKLRKTDNANLFLKDKVIELSIDKIAMSNRTYHALKRANIKNITELSFYTLDEIWNFQGVWIEVFKEIIKLMFRFNVRPKED